MSESLGYLLLLSFTKVKTKLLSCLYQNVKLAIRIKLHAHKTSLS